LRNLERDADADDERGRWAWGALTDAEPARSVSTPDR